LRDPLRQQGLDQRILDDARANRLPFYPQADPLPQRHVLGGQQRGSSPRHSGKRSSRRVKSEILTSNFRPDPCSLHADGAVRKGLIQSIDEAAKRQHTSKIGFRP
jgi:hypothetical protein